jgi:hypothetical protein
MQRRLILVDRRKASDRIQKTVIEAVVIDHRNLPHHHALALALAPELMVAVGRQRDGFSRREGDRSTGRQGPP